MFSVQFRGQETDIEIDKYDDDPETNSFVIEWHFVDPLLQGVELTDQEEADVFLECDRHIQDRSQEAPGE